MNERLVAVIEYMGLTQKDFGIKLGGKSRQLINHWCTGRQNIPDNVIIEIIRLFPKEVNARWFVTGEEEMLYGDEQKKVKNAEEPTPPYKLKNTEPEDLTGRLWKRIDDLEALNTELFREIIACREKGRNVKGESPGGVEKSREIG
jgi:transcriptional regulator with XRE-family HTH domain